MHWIQYVLEGSIMYLALGITSKHSGVKLECLEVIYSPISLATRQARQTFCFVDSVIIKGRACGTYTNFRW